MKTILITILTLITLTSYAKHGDSLDVFNGIVVYENDTRISRHGGTNFECYEYIERYYAKIYNIDIRDYAMPSFYWDGISVYMAKDLFKNSYSGKTTSDGKVKFIKRGNIKQGDIIVYDNRTRTGHVAIAISSTHQIQQNTSSVITRIGNYKGIVRYVGDDTLTKD